MAFSFVHTADLHLDCPIEGVADIPSHISSVLRNATFVSFQNIVDLCINQNVDFLLVAGDAYNSADKSIRAQLKFRAGLTKLAEHGIQTFIVFGNHDPADGWSASIDWPDTVHVFSHKEVDTIPIIRNGNLIANVTGTSYPKRDVNENLSIRYKCTDRSCFSIAMLHCNCGTPDPSGNYSSCTVSELTRCGFDYWALGHIHKRTILSDSEPLVVYPGNPQGLNPKETGPKGCYLVKVDDLGSAHAEFIATDSIRWFAEDICIDNITREQDLLSTLESKVSNIRTPASKPAILRLNITGRTELHKVLAKSGFLKEITSELRERESGESDFWIESINDFTKPDVDLAERRKAEDFVGDFLKTIDEARANPEMLRSIIEPLFSANGARKHLSTPDDQQLLEWLSQAEIYGFDALSGEGES